MEKREFESAPGSTTDTAPSKPQLLHEATSQQRQEHRRSINERREQQILNLRKRAFRYTLVSSSTMLVVILIITLLQGFRLWGFDLPKEIFYALLVATIGTVAKSLLIVMRCLFGPEASGRE